MSVAKWIWKAITYPFVFMYDPDKVIQREFEDEGPLDKDAHLSEYERSAKGETDGNADAKKQP